MNMNHEQSAMRTQIVSTGNNSPLVNQPMDILIDLLIRLSLYWHSMVQQMFVTNAISVQK